MSPESEKTSILLVHKHLEIQPLLKLFVQKSFDVEIVEADTVHEAIDILLKKKIAVVISEWRINGESALEIYLCLKKLRHQVFMALLVDELPFSFPIKDPISLEVIEGFDVRRLFDTLKVLPSLARLRLPSS